MSKIDVYEHGVLRIGEQGFLFTHWQACTKFNEAHSNEYFDILHNGLRFKHYVGALQIGNLVIQIHPKADKNEDDDKWKGVLIQMLKACGHLKAQTHDNAHLDKQHFNLLELYFEYFLAELEKLIHQGLIKRYRENTGNVKALKGKLDFARNIRHNLVHQERFYTTHQVYDVNHRLHQILQYALEIVSQFSRGTQLSDRCGRTRLTFPEVSAIRPAKARLDQIYLDRKTASYERALQLAKLIILNYSPDIEQGQHKMISLLFDMNVLWEEYVYTVLRKSKQLREAGWKVHGQQSKLFYSSGRYIRPDIVLTDEKETIIIDTKWKIPSNNSASIEDLKQMYIYGRFWSSAKLILLYPGQKHNPSFKLFRNDHGDNIQHACKVARISVLSGPNQLNSLVANEMMHLMELSIQEPENHK
nr:restriction endonuclease [uncultured Fluviicola sp.]